MGSLVFTCIYIYIYSHFFFLMGKGTSNQLLAVHRNELLFKWTPSTMMRSEEVWGWRFNGGGVSGVGEWVICYLSQVDLLNF